ncbi:hypothetical protein B0J11DRAFT_271411 [Dendryphion nanum]|uniref:Uncharacterized protein n=1 Tax=Dendryphion nanum TaxID=256645 RepID=A0A9P9IRE3_9PLEO|nr:hypothetical protein B0J11DRAFT_271411 [Dendryphion nanum]
MVEQGGRNSVQGTASPPQNVTQPSTDPEVVPPPEDTNYLYSIPDPVPQQKVDNGYIYAPPPEQYTSPPLPPSKPKWWTRWPFLLLLGLVLAVISGLAGGFIGQAIERGNESGGDQSQRSCAPPTSNSTCTSQPPNPQNNTSWVPPIPSTGCPGSNQQNLTSLRTKVSYQMYCSTGWVLDDVININALAPSDCIEACANYNKFRGDKPKCIGVGYVPRWVDQTVAMRELGDPFNCFLKKSTANVARNDRAFEVISMCLDGECTITGV